MRIIRRAREDYVQIGRDVIEDRRLSFTALGLLGRLRSLPENSRLTVAELAEGRAEDESAILRALAELDDAGYLDREPSS